MDLIFSIIILWIIWYWKNNKKWIAMKFYYSMLKLKIEIAVK